MSAIPYEIFRSLCHIFGLFFCPPRPGHLRTVCGWSRGGCLRRTGPDGCRRCGRSQDDGLGWNLPLRLACRSLHIIPLALYALPLRKPRTRLQLPSGTNKGFDSVGRTYHPSGKRGGGDDGPAVSAGFSCAIFHHHVMDDRVEKVEAIHERDAMRLRARKDDPVGSRAWLGDHQIHHGRCPGT